MTARRLIDLFERFSGAASEVDRLRTFIKDLAVRGKLVSQDPQDTPVSDFLKHVGAHRASTGLGRPLKRSKAGEATAGNFDFGIPEAWTWATFGEIVVSRDGERIPVSREERDGREKKYDYYGASGVIDKIDNYLFDKPLLLIGEDGANLISRSTPIAFIARGKYWVNNHAHVIDGLSEDFLQYLELFINSIDLKPYVTGTAQPKMNQAKMNSIPVAVPPPEEQRRIVAKVNELMALCDQLEKARADRETRRDKLTAATLARLTAPNPKSFHNHARFALDNLQALTTRPDQIKQLRQTIVNLAVRGRLVPGASGAAYGCSAAKQEHQSELPSWWQHLPLGRLLREETRNGYSKRPDDAKNGIPILRISAGTTRRDGIVAEEVHKLISGIDAKVREQYSLQPGDLLACRFNGNKEFVGRLTLFKDYLGLRPIYPDKLIRVRLDPRIATPSFLRIAGDSDLVRAEIERFCATTVGNWGISASNLKEVRFPLPPLMEQGLIVDKVDQLMRLCDQLESSLTAGDETRRQLLKAVLSEALQLDAAVGSR